MKKLKETLLNIWAVAVVGVIGLLWLGVSVLLSVAPLVIAGLIIIYVIRLIV